MDDPPSTSPARTPEGSSRHRSRRLHRPFETAAALWATLCLVALVTIYSSSSRVWSVDTSSSARRNSLFAPDLNRMTSASGERDFVYNNFTLPMSTEKVFPITVHLGSSRAFFKVALPNTVYLATSQPAASYFGTLLPRLKKRGGPKFNGLDLWRRWHVVSGRFARDIEKDDESRLADDRTGLLDDMDQYGMDDDDGYSLRYDERDYPRECVRPAWTDWQFPACNTFHESMTVERPAPIATRHGNGGDDAEIRYLAHGDTRDSFLWNATTSGVFVLKRLRLAENLDNHIHLLDQIRTEALIMERLSASPHIANIYGHCGTSVAVEAAFEISLDIVPRSAHQSERGRIPQKRLDRLQRENKVAVVSFNNYTAEEKLDIATQMTAAVAELHGFAGSVIVHDDIHPEQWLQVPTKDGGRRMILNDMNNAVFLEWNSKEQDYCQYYRSYGGDFHAPEELVGSDVDETADIWSVGNVIFTLLTGLWPYYELPFAQREKLQALTVDGVLPYINPAYARRSNIEYRLVELMMLCYRRDPEERLSIFEVVEHLRHTKRLREVDS